MTRTATARQGGRLRRLSWAAIIGIAASTGCLTARPGTSSLLTQARESFEARRYAEVLGLLDGPGLQKLRGREVPRGYEFLGQSQERLGHPDSALRTYQTAAGLFPKDINLLTHQANLLHRGGLDNQARPFYERILALSPGNAAAHFGLAETERRLGFLDRAARHYEATLKEWGDQSLIWADYAEVLSDARLYSKALEAIERALTLTDTATARLDQARILWRLGRRDEGFQALARAEVHDPANLGLTQQRALWQLEVGDLPQAELSATAVLKAQPEDPLGLWLRAAIMLRLGRPEEARPMLERAANQRRAPFVATAAAELLKQLR